MPLRLLASLGSLMDMVDLSYIFPLILGWDDNPYDVGLIYLLLVCLSLEMIRLVYGR